MDRDLVLWARVVRPAELRALRTARAADGYVVSGPTPLYGRPGETIVVDLDPVPPGDPETIVSGLPMRAGALVPPGASGLAVIRALAERRREPRAVRVGSELDARRALEAGATVLVVDVERAEAIRDLAGHTSLLAWCDSERALRRAAEIGLSGALLPAAVILSGAASAAGRRPVRRSIPGLGLGRSSSSDETIGASLDRARRAYGGVEAVVHVARRRRSTYRELADAVEGVARALLAVGVQRGDRVALLARNIPEWPAVQLATAVIGGVLVTVNPSLAEEELEYVLENSGARLLIAAPRDEVQAAVIGRVVARRPSLRIVVVGSATGLPDGSASWSSFLDGGRSVDSVRLGEARRAVEPDDIAAILYTSGTTGLPKGAMLSHRGMLHNAAAVAENLGLGPSDRLCLAVPFHHCFGSVMGTLAALLAGTTLVLPDDWFDAAAVLEAIAREGCTVVYGVPTMFIALLDAARGKAVDLSSLRTGIIAGAPVDPDLAARVERELHVPELVIAYGLTEASPVVTQTARTDPPSIRLGTVGRPIPGAEVKIVDPETGRDVPDGTPGELVTRGPMVMAGYYGDPEATKAVIDAAGWLHTGDLAIRDPSGPYRIVGRIKEMIIRGGENIYPAEIEAVGRRHPGVADVAVVGVPSAYFGEEVAAFVRLAPGASITTDELRRHFAEHLAPFKVPRWISILDRFPLTGSGKVRKHELRERAARLFGEQAAAPGAAADHGQGPLAPAERPRLPFMAPKEGAGRTPTAADAPSTMSSSPAPELPSDRERSRAPVLSPPLRLPDRSPRAGWIRPAVPTWVWRLRAAEVATSAPPGPEALESTGRSMSTANEPVTRRRGQRIKTWGIGGDVRRQIEATGEHPIMYRALGTPPQRTHPFNLYGDIRSQPDALRGTFEASDEIVDVARRIAERRPSGAIGLGSGTSQFVAQVANAALARFAGIPGWDYDSLHFLRYPPPIDFGRFVAFAYSGSGSTVDTVAAARQCRASGALTVAFTSVDGSPIVEATDARVLTAGGFDTGGSDTFHYTTRVAASIYLALELGKRFRPGAEDYDRLQRDLLATADAMDRIFDAVDARCRTIAERFLDVRSILVVGAGPNYGTAEEVALKFDEMAHIPTKAMNPGRHIHGALGLTDEQILTVLVAPPGPSYQEMVALAKVTEILKTPSVAIVSEDDTEVADRCDYVIRLPASDEVIFAVLAVLPGQLLPYWCGVGLGLNPDTQRSNIPKHAKVWNMLFPPGTH
ncbi:MAG TPA: AMP-binding protein [Candidatus Binatia bacterium]|nr:AMP-binding protein [Candidatus Binatia bacterium]